MPTNEGIIIENLTKRFPGRQVDAVHNVTFSIKTGTIFGFLGPNGAGKSTTIRLLSTLLTPDRGTAYIAGYSIDESAAEVRRNIGVLPEEATHTLYPYLTVKHTLTYFGQLYGLEYSDAEERAYKLLKIFELEDRMEDMAGALSTGMRQKLALARSLIHDPKVLFLDEPLSSLDPVMAKKVREYVIKLGKSGKTTIFLSSHVLSTVQELCDEVGIIDNGELIQLGSLKSLLHDLWPKHKFRLRVSEAASVASRLISDTGFATLTGNEGNTIHYEITNPDQENPALVNTLVGAGVKIIELSENQPSLEDAYIEIIRSKGETKQ